MLMSPGIIKHLAFATCLSVMQCKQSFVSVHDIEFEGRKKREKILESKPSELSIVN